MKLTRKELIEMLNAAKPLINWINDNCHPHCRALVDNESVELLEGIAKDITLKSMAKILNQQREFY